jgi:hypothetical protein
VRCESFALRSLRGFESHFPTMFSFVGESGRRRTRFRSKPNTHSGRRAKLFAFPPERCSPSERECCSDSQRNGVRLHSGIEFAFDRNPQPRDLGLLSFVLRVETMETLPDGCLFSAFRSGLRARCLFSASEVIGHCSGYEPVAMQGKCLESIVVCGCTPKHMDDGDDDSK